MDGTLGMAHDVIMFDIYITENCMDRKEKRNFLVTNTSENRSQFLSLKLVLVHLSLRDYAALFQVYPALARNCS